MKLALLPKYNNRVSDERWSSLQKASDLLKLIIPKSCSVKNEVGIAGSASLLMYQEKHRVGPKWGPNGDIDVFVAGRFGRSETHFFAFVYRAFSILSRIGETPHLMDRYMSYGRHNLRFWVFDFEIPGVLGKISFVQSPDCDNLKEVVAHFDINVCRVVFNPCTKKFWCSRRVALDISKRAATVDGVVFSKHGPTDDDIVQVTRVLNRMAKYGKRGFRFANGGGVSLIRLHDSAKRIPAKRSLLHT